MKIVIEDTPHQNHRYPTCGDWWVDPDGTLQIRVSRELPNSSKAAVAIHELVEFYCLSRGFDMSHTDQMALVAKVDAFDMHYENSRLPGDESEPGDDPLAPYNIQHSIATAVERILLASIGERWGWHESAVNKLFQ